MVKTYTVKELEEILKVKKGKIREFIKTGELKAVYLGKSYIVKEDDVQEFLKMHEFKKN